MKYAIIFLTIAGSLVAVGCDDNDAEDGGVDGAVDAGGDAGDLTGPATNCMMRCQDRTAECNAPPTIAEMRCELICAGPPSEEQLRCVEAVECESLMMSFFTFELPTCSLDFGMDAGPPADAGPADAGVDGGGGGDAGDMDSGTLDSGTDASVPDAGPVDAGPPLDGGAAECERRCDTKLVDECGSPTPDMARMRCDDLCSASTTEATIMCFEDTECSVIISSFIGGTPTPCFAD